MTSPELDQWPPSDRKYRRSEVTVVLGNGDAVWKRAADGVLRWRVKTASGFVVDSTGPVSPGDRVVVRAHLFGFTVVEPVEVGAAVRGFAQPGFANGSD